MKISKSQLRQIIKEEKARLLSEQIAGGEEGNILKRLDEAASLFEAYADRYGSMDWEEEGPQGDSEETRMLERIAKLKISLESYFDQYGPQAFG